MNNLRTIRKSDVLPVKKEGQSIHDFIMSNNGGEIIVYGSIGNGDKMHKLMASYINVNGENIIIYCHSICGAESYKSWSSINLDSNNCNCKKCIKTK